MSRSEVAAALGALPAIPRDGEGPVFAEPWHAEAFAMAVALHQHGLFSWAEWSEALASQLRRLELDSRADGEDGYYHGWLCALESMLEERRIVLAGERIERIEAWDRAARATPHGEPIVLGRDRGEG